MAHLIRQKTMLSITSKCAENGYCMSCPVGKARLDVLVVS